MIQKRHTTPAEAQLKMASLCARSEQCSYDICIKLRRLGLNEHEIKEVTRFLTDNSFLDDSRFARSYANDKCRFSGWGKRKISQGLASKRIPSIDIREAVDNINDSDYHDALMRAANAKARTMNLRGPDARENKRRLYMHLLSRGFESDISIRAINEICNPNHNQ